MPFASAEAGGLAAADSINHPPLLRPAGGAPASSLLKLKQVLLHLLHLWRLRAAAAGAASLSAGASWTALLLSSWSDVAPPRPADWPPPTSTLPHSAPLPAYCFCRLLAAAGLAPRTPPRRSIDAAASKHSRMLARHHPSAAVENEFSHLPQAPPASSLLPRSSLLSRRHRAVVEFPSLQQAQPRCSRRPAPSPPPAAWAL